MTIKLAKWDVVEHLQNDDDIVAYFETCCAEADAALLTAALSSIARAWRMDAVVIKYCAGTNGFTGSIPAIPETYSQGKTFAELRAVLNERLSSIGILPRS